MKSSKNRSSGSRALLIDVDNCPNQIEELPRTISEFSRIIACYGTNDPKVRLSLVPILAEAINKGKLEIFGMKKKGKNAADFGLAFWAGRLLAEMPEETEFLILSQDTDLDHVVNMLRASNRKVTRVNGKARNVASSSPVSDEKNGKDTVSTHPPVSSETVGKNSSDLSKGDSVEKYLSTYLQHKNRPARKATLLNSIKSFCMGHNGVKPESVLRELIKRGIVTIDEQGRISYPKL
ncbi:PIN domain-containing protein [Desulfobacterales bacterium HSG2]|nr:PIN domain-containing protein [Desulfobacterales bacterium HSG2]